MKLSREDVTPLTAIVVGGLVGLSVLGPWSFEESPTTVTSTVVAVPVAEAPPAPGHRVSPPSPATGAKIRIRSAGDLVTQPLVYVDGIRIESGMPELDPSRIDRIEVVKGAAAQALFGSDASGGVIQIYTKSTPAGDPRR